MAHASQIELTGDANAVAIDPKVPNPEDDKLVDDETTLIDEGFGKHKVLVCCYFMWIFSIWLVEILVQCNTPAYIFTLSNCQRSSKYFNRLPLFDTYKGNSSNADFYFDEWHFIPNLGLCPSTPMPVGDYLPHFSAKSPTRRLDAPVEAEALEEAEMDGDRNLRGSGGGGGGRGGGGRSSSSKGSSSKSSSSSSYSSRNRGRTYYGTSGYRNSRLGGAAAVGYVGCITFGRKEGSQTKDRNSIDVWAAIDAANGDPNYNPDLGLPNVDSDFATAAKGMLTVDSIMVLGTVLSGIGYPLVNAFMCCFHDIGCASGAMIYIEMLIQLATTAIALAILNYLPDNGFINRDTTTPFTKTIFPTCTVTIDDGPLFTMYLYLVIVSGMCLFFGIVAEVRYHCCMSHKRQKYDYERTDYVAPVAEVEVPVAAGKRKAICGKCNNKLVKLEVDPYLAIGQHGICDGCNAEQFYVRDSRGYHCCVCSISDNYDLCAACVDEEHHANGLEKQVEAEAAPAEKPKGNRALTKGHKEMGQALVKMLKKKTAKGDSEPVPTSDPTPAAEESAPAATTFAVPSTAQGVPMHKG